MRLEQISKTLHTDLYVSINPLEINYSNLGWIRGNNPGKNSLLLDRLLYLSINDIMISHFDIPFLDGIKVSSDLDYIKDQTDGNYTIPCRLSPIDQFHFCWSPQYSNISDSYTDLDLSYTELFHDIANKYRTENIYRAIDSGNEIMIYCNRCVVTPV